MIKIIIIIIKREANGRMDNPLYLITYRLNIFYLMYIGILWPKKTSLLGLASFIALIYPISILMPKM